MSTRTRTHSWVKSEMKVNVSAHIDEAYLFTSYDGESVTATIKWIDVIHTDTSDRVFLRNEISLTLAQAMELVHVMQQVVSATPNRAGEITYVVQK